MTSSRVRWSIVLLAAFLAAVVFAKALQFGFVDLDDSVYVLENPRIVPLTPGTVLGMFTDTYFRSYAPLTLLSHAVDWRIWGSDPFGHHLTSILLHAANTGLLVLLILTLLKARSEKELRTHNAAGAHIAAFVATLFFAIHPLRVESVAWISDRKDILATLFFLLMLISYVRGRRKREDAQKGWDRWIARVFFLFGLLCKASIAPAAACLPLIDFVLEPDERPLTILKSRVKLYLPYFLFAFLAIAGNWLAVPALGATLRDPMTNPLYRVLLPLYSLAFYPAKTFAPFQLAPLYAFPSWSILIVGSAAGIAILGLLVFAWRRGCQVLLMGVGGYVVMILPVVSALSVGADAWSDRYTYPAIVLPCVALGLALSYAGRGARLKVGRWLGVLAVAGSVALLGLVAMTLDQLEMWRNSRTLWTRQLAVNDREPTALDGMAKVLLADNNPAGARGLMLRAISIDPTRIDIFLNMASTCLTRRDSLGMIATLEDLKKRAIAGGRIRICLGDMYAGRGMADTAETLLKEALDRDPSSGLEAYRSLGRLYHNSGRDDSAAAMLSRALGIVPNSGELWYDLSVVFRSMGQVGRADAALQLSQDFGGKEAVRRAPR